MSPLCCLLQMGIFCSSFLHLMGFTISFVLEVIQENATAFSMQTHYSYLQP